MELVQLIVLINKVAKSLFYRNHEAGPKYHIECRIKPSLERQLMSEQVQIISD